MTNNNILESEIYIVSNPENIFYNHSFFGKETVISGENRVLDYGTIGRSYPINDCRKLTDQEKIRQVLGDIWN